MARKLGQQLLVIYGPPGTGKTTRVLDLFASELEHGTDPERIALVTFSKAAQVEAATRLAKRFDLRPDETPWVRTLHSTAYRLLGLSRNQVYSPGHHREFCRQHSYRLTAVGRGQADDLQPAPRRTQDDDLRAVHEWSLQRDVSLRQGWAHGPIAPVTWHVLERYVERFDGWKRDRNVADFFDMLVRARDLLGPSVDVCFIDEAQDLSPLQIAIAYQWFGGCSRVYVAGDDDQSIFSFLGADPSWLIGLRDECDHHEVLTQSYRLPDRVRTIANRIIRENAHRVEKHYASARRGGRVRGMRVEVAARAVADRAEDPDWTCLWLVRNRYHAKPMVECLLQAGAPFRAEIPPYSPLDNKPLCLAVQAGIRILEGSLIPASEFRAWIACQGGSTKIPANTVKRAAALVRPMNPADLICDWQIGHLVDRLHELGPALSLGGVATPILSYLQKMLSAYGELPSPPPITVTTIHAAKGREADTVVVSSDMSRASYLDMRHGREGENRVAYVAVTRARDEVIICDPLTSRSYPYIRLVDQLQKGDLDGQKD